VGHAQRRCTTRLRIVMKCVAMMETKNKSLGRDDLQDKPAVWFLVLQTGTMAANLNLSASFTAAGAPLVPNPAVYLTTSIPALPPAVATPPAVNLNPTTPGADFEVTVTGYATTREMTDASFTFAPKNNYNVSSSAVAIANFGSAAASWYASSASLSSGGTFVFTQPFKVTGDKTGIASVTVTLKNSAGTSASSTASFP